MRLVFPIASLFLAGSLWSRTDSVLTRNSTDSITWNRRAEQDEPVKPDTMTDSAAKPIGTTGAPRTVSVRWLPMEVYRFRAEDLDSVSAVSNRRKVSNQAKSDSASHLKFGGSKTIKVGVGGNGGMALDQTLFLTAEGELSPGVRMKARLSDGDMPLSSQGSSATLREVDELYLEVESERWLARLGDQDWKLAPDLAPGIDRKLRGFTAGWKNSTRSASLTLGGSQAKWKRVAFQGAEGRQEGYALAAWQGGLHGVVVPGSERVRVNGQALKRGADADYVMRYSEGLLDFTTHRRISSSDAIEVEFQSADLDYERGFAGASTKGRSGKLGWEAWGARESDDATHPLSYAPDTASRRILRDAGSDTAAARLPDGQVLALPNQVGEAGFRLRLGDSIAWFATEMRGSDFDRNVMSDRDARTSGYFGSGMASFHVGDFVSGGGLGRLTTTLRGDRVDARFHGLGSRDSLGSGNSGFWAPASTGERATGEGRLAWDLLPGIGISTEAGARSDANGWASRYQTDFGIDRGPDKQFRSSLGWVRLDDGDVPRTQTTSRTRVAWPVDQFNPSLEATTETRDQIAGSALRNRAMLGALAGSTWKSPSQDLETGLFASVRKDAIRPTRESEMEDTARSIGTNAKLRWSPAVGDLDIEVDWKNLETRQIPRLPWVRSSSWLGSATGGFWPGPGFRSQARWKLSSSSYQPEIPRYDTVPAGTGAWRYDTLLRTVVPSDQGDLRLAGTMLDTSRPAVRATRRNLSIESELEPGKLVPGLAGLLADIGLRGHADWDETDSTSATRIWPHFSDQDLSMAIAGRSELSIGAWWALERRRLEFEWTRSLSVQSAPTVAKMRDMTERVQWSSSTVSGHRLDIVGIRGDLRDAQPDRLRLESYWTIDPSIGIRVAKTVEARPGWRSKWAKGTESDKSFAATLQSPYASLRADLPHSLSLRGEIRRTDAKVDALAGSRLAEGYPDGATWRLTGSLDWSWTDHIQARAEWVGRKEPSSPWFQKMSCEAKAIF